MPSGSPLAQVPNLVTYHGEAQIIQEGDENAPGFTRGDRHAVVIHDFQVNIRRKHMQPSMAMAFAGHVATLSRAVFVKHLRLETGFEYAAKFGSKGASAAHDG